MASLSESYRWRQTWTAVRETVRSWNEDNVPRLPAALSCYMILSIAPLGVLSVAIAGAVFGPGAARGQIAAKLGSVVGTEAARAIETVILNTHAPSAGMSSTVLGLLVLIFGASGAFVELQSAMNKIWRVPPEAGQRLMKFVRRRLASFAMVIVVASLLLVTLFLSGALAAVGKFFGGALPGGKLVWQVANASVSLGLTTVLFALVFRVVPDIQIPWKAVWPGALVTAFLFTLGKALLGLYIGESSVTSSLGAAGSLVALVFWVYCSSQVVFLGAEFTAVCSRQSTNAP